MNITAKQIGSHNCIYIFKQQWLVTSRNMQSQYMGLYHSSKYPYIEHVNILAVWAWFQNCNHLILSKKKHTEKHQEYIKTNAYSSVHHLTKEGSQLSSHKNNRDLV